MLGYTSQIKNIFVLLNSFSILEVIVENIKNTFFCKFRISNRINLMLESFALLVLLMSDSIPDLSVVKCY